jgi:hypothetical protein
MPDSRGSRVSRESRLLLLTVAVCAMVLLLLARLRFPNASPVVEAPAPAPLERLAARASYDALASDIEKVEPRIAPNLIVLRVTPKAPADPRGIRDALAPSRTAPGVRHVAALRIGEETAVAALDAGTRIDGIVGGDEAGTAAVLATNPIRRLARLRVPKAAAQQLSQLPLSSLETPAYVVAVEGTQAGVTLRPVFLGRGDRLGSRRWTQPLLPLGGVAVTPGALIFSLAGDFIGTVVTEDGAPAIAGARDVLDTAASLTNGVPSAPADLGISVQPLTSRLMTALGVSRGVVISDVAAGAPADGKLQPADVITGVDDWFTNDPDELLIRLSAQRPGVTVTIAFVRNHQPRTVAITLPGDNTSRAAQSLRLSIEPGVGTRVDASGEAGDVLAAGDVITRAGSIDAPTPRQVRAILSQPAAGFAILVVRRDWRQRVVAVPVTAAVDAAIR